MHFGSSDFLQILFVLCCHVTLHICVTPWYRIFLSRWYLFRFSAGFHHHCCPSFDPTLRQFNPFHIVTTFLSIKFNINFTFLLECNKRSLSICMPTTVLWTFLVSPSFATCVDIVTLLHFAHKSYIMLLAWSDEHLNVDQFTKNITYEVQFMLKNNLGLIRWNFILFSSGIKWNSVSIGCSMETVYLSIWCFCWCHVHSKYSYWKFCGNLCHMS